MNLLVSTIILIVGIWSFFLYPSTRRYFDRINKHWEAFVSADVVTVAIPARNEELHIEECVRSLQHQKHQNLEILVLDDNSTDATASLVLELQKQDSRIRLITGKPLEDGWTGKLFAMQQLYEAGKGSYILFTDADTRHTPDSVSYGLFLLASQKGEMISGYPKQITRSLALEVLVSVMLFNPALFVPFRLQASLQWPLFSMAIGQYLMIKREALISLGGFIPIKGQICDDVALARLCAKKGHKQLFAPMQTALQCEMFTTFSQGWKSLERSIIGVVKQGLLGFLLILLIVLVLLLLSFAPILSVVFGVLAFSNQSYMLPCIFSLAGSLLLFTTWKRCATYFGFSPQSGRFGPLTILLVVLMYLNGLILRLSGRGFLWKGRVIT
jgi:chlorobactene glucosyltransferase